MRVMDNINMSDMLNLVEIQFFFFFYTTLKEWVFLFISHQADSTGTVCGQPWGERKGNGRRGKKKGDLVSRDAATVTSQCGD